MDPTPIVRVALYARYSSAAQDDGYSLEAQHARYLQEADRHPEWQVTYYDEPATSAFTDDIAKRPVFAKLLDDVRAGALDLVVVHRLDRWARHTATAHYAWDVLHKHSVGFLSLDEHMDMTTPYGWLNSANEAARAQFYSMTLSVRVREGHAQRAAHGLPFSFVPFGYIHTGTKSAAIPDRDTDGAWWAVRRMYELACAGHTHQEIADLINGEGKWFLTTPGVRGTAPRPFTRRSVYEILRNPYYRPFQPADDRGTVMLSGTEYRGQHVPAVSWETWQAAQEVIRGRRRGWTSEGLSPKEHRRAAPKTAEFRGLIACSECGHPLHVLASPGVPGYDDARYDRYGCQASRQGRLCTQSGQWARVAQVRALWVEWCAAHLTLPDGWEYWIREWAAREASEAKGSTDPLRVHRERAKWERMREAANDLYEAGQRTREWWREQLARCDREIGRLAREAIESGQHATELLDAGAYVTGVVETWREAADIFNTPEADPQLVREVVLRLQQTASVLIEPGGLLVKPLGYRGMFARAHRSAMLPEPMSCELVEVRLRAPYRELMAMVTHDFVRAS